MSLYTNSMNFHNVPIPYEFPTIADLCMNNGYSYDGYVDFIIPEDVSGIFKDSIILDNLMRAETLAHVRLQAKLADKLYGLKLSLCCTTDHVHYRLYYSTYY